MTYFSLFPYIHQDNSGLNP